MILRTVALALALGPTAALAEVNAPAAPPSPQVGSQASVAEDAQAIFDAMQLGEVIDIMTEEGTADAVTMAESLFPTGQAPREWSDMVQAIYDPVQMKSDVLEDLTLNLEGAETGAILAFLETAAGSRMAELEVAARRAMVDPEAEQAAKEEAAVAMSEDSPRLELLRRYIEATDLIEGNVAGAMNSNYAYFMGLLDGGALQREMTESDVLSDIAGQEAQIRADTTEWVYSFLLKAYAPASDADLQAIIDFAATEPGRALNRALFATFDARYKEISRALGLTAARYMTSREI